MPISASPQIGESVNVKVKRVLSFGLHVTLDDGRPGLIRARELPRKADSAHMTMLEQYKAGDMLAAVVVARDPDRPIELSVRLAQNDPWAEIPQRYTTGQLITGVVTGVQAYGVFLEIEPGVAGLLHKTHLPNWPGLETANLFWPGDHVQAIIDDIDQPQRRISFSLRDIRGRRWEKTATAPLSGKRATTDRLAASAGPPLALQLWLKAQPQTLLVIEDDDDQRQAVANWLRNAGQHVLAAASAEAAWEILQGGYTPDLVLADVGLPGQSGLSAVQAMRQQWPEMRYVIMTDWARAEEHSVELEGLRVAGVHLLIKPFLPDELLTVLMPQAAASGEASPTRSAMPLSTAPTESFIALPEARQSLRKILEEARKAIGAGKAVLFALEPAHQRITIVAESGATRLKEAALLRLIYTPVRDVAEGELLIHIKDAQAAEGRVRYLRPLLDFQSCLGVSVAGAGFQQYALFFFHQRANAFDKPHEQFARTYAMALDALLENQALRTRLANLQRLAILGNLTRALIHEVNHQLSPISFSIDELQNHFRDLEQTVVTRPDAAQAERELQQAAEALRALARRLSNLARTASLFREVTVRGHEQILRLDEAVEEVAKLLKEQADQARVTIEVLPTQALIFTRAETAQVQQILLNVMVNAVQQIARLRPTLGGRVQVKLEHVQRDQQPWLQVRVEDDGPGIHWRLWERIFEPGFTTRAGEGNGLGLYICRSLAETMGGRIMVVDSHILWGTTFLIELPFRS